MQARNRPLRDGRMETSLNPTRFDSDLWLRADAPLNHRFDKLGNRLPLELHGCGCSLCARQQRDLLKFWEAR
jgi:uncharacterized protein (UPF0276 family)